MTARRSVALPGYEYRRLLDAARRSLERTGGDLAGSVSVSQPTEAERKAIIGITGQYRDARTAKISVRLADLDRPCARPPASGWPELLSDLGGPLRDRRAERQASARPGPLSRPSRGSTLDDSCDWYRSWLGNSSATGR